jgi:hypothetical protein
MTYVLKLRPLARFYFIKIHGESQDPDDFKNFKTLKKTRQGSSWLNLRLFRDT